MGTIIFNTFVLMQVFNEFNARFLENELNIFKGLFTNPIFWGVIVITVVLQAIIVEFGSYFTQTAQQPPAREGGDEDVELSLLQGPASDESINQNARTLKPGSKWAAVQEVHVNMAVVNSFRRSGRK